MLFSVCLAEFFSPGVAGKLLHETTIALQYFSARSESFSAVCF